jgi:tyrosinase
MVCNARMPLTPLRAPQDSSQELRHRVSVFNLSPEALTALRDATAKMQARGDNKGYLSLAGIHGWPQFRCQHTTNQGQAFYFLPWHRAYLYFFELALQDQNPAARLCWWDWPGSLQVGIPDPYAEQDVEGKPNPLASGPRPQGMPRQPKEWGPVTQRTPRPAAELPAQSVVDEVLEISDYYQFELSLEEQLHDLVHDWVGGDMGVIATAAYDPIFWAHHTMVDRLWSLWQSRHASPGPPPDTYATPLGFEKLTVGDVLDSKRLGYDYAASVQQVEAPAEALHPEQAH